MHSKNLLCIVNILFQVPLNSLIKPEKMVGTAGFEPATSGTQNPNHTKLDYVPMSNKILFPNLSMIDYDSNQIV